MQPRGCSQTRGGGCLGKAKRHCRTAVAGQQLSVGTLKALQMLNVDVDGHGTQHTAGKNRTLLRVARPRPQILQAHRLHVPQPPLHSQPAPPHPGAPQCVSHATVLVDSCLTRALRCRQGSRRASGAKRSA
jgi:hypothetical protein